MGAEGQVPTQCCVYRGGLRGDTYLFVPGRERFERVPPALMRGLGRLELAMEIELYPGRRLARTDADEVLASLAERGYYLQLPPVDSLPAGPLQ